MANEASKFTMADGTDVSIVDSRIGDLTSTGITGSTVAAQLKELKSNDIGYISRTVQVDTISNNNLHTYIEIPVWAHQIVLALAGDNNTTRFSTIFPLTQFAIYKTQQVNGYISNERVFFTVKYVDSTRVYTDALQINSGQSPYVDRGLIIWTSY